MNMYGLAYKLVDFPEISVIEIVTLDPKVHFHRLGKKVRFVCIGFCVIFLSSVSVR